MKDPRKDLSDINDEKIKENLSKYFEEADFVYYLYDSKKDILHLLYVNNCDEADVEKIDLYVNSHIYDLIKVDSIKSKNHFDVNFIKKYREYDVL